jgi:hypothetical protein
MSTCPLCGATTGVSPDPEMRFKCNVCGGPRIPEVSPSLKRSGRENTALKTAEEARKKRAGGRAAVIAGGLGITFTVFVFAIFWLIFGFGVPSAIAFLVLGGPLAGLLAWGSARAKKAASEIQPALDAAWLAAATDVAARSGGQLSARDLAAALGLDEAKAEELLAVVDVNRAIGSGAQQRTDAMAAFDAKLRVATGAGGGAGAEEAELEAAAENEAAGEAAARARAGREP